MSKPFAPFRHVGGSRSVVESSDGSAWRRTSGGVYHACYARPVSALAALLAEAGIPRPSSLECILWDDGAVLVIARHEGGISHEWVAVLDPGSSVAPLLSEDDRAVIRHEERMDVEAWSCLSTGPDGVERLDRTRCVVPIHAR